MTTKSFDAVKLMRELRDKLSQDMEHMTPEERLKYVHDKAASTSLGRKLIVDAPEVPEDSSGPDQPSVSR